jgi:hypothetical protein
MSPKAFEKFLNLSEEIRMGLYEDYLLQEEIKKRALEQDNVAQSLKREKVQAKLTGKIFDKQSILDEEINKKRIAFINQPIYYDLTETEIKEVKKQRGIIFDSKQAIIN